VNETCPVNIDDLKQQI